LLCLPRLQSKNTTLQKLGRWNRRDFRKLWIALGERACEHRGMATERRQLGRPPSTTSGRIAVTISEAMKMRASLWSLRHRVPLAQMVEEGLRLYMDRERTKRPPITSPGLPGVEQPPEPEQG